MRGIYSGFRLRHGEFYVRTGDVFRNRDGNTVEILDCEPLDFFGEVNRDAWCIYAFNGKGEYNKTLGDMLTWLESWGYEAL